MITGFTGSAEYMEWSKCTPGRAETDLIIQNVKSKIHPLTY